MSTSKSASPWDLNTFSMTGAIAALLATTVIYLFWGSYLLALPIGITLGLVLGALSAYRPLHEEFVVKGHDHERVHP